MRKKKPSQRVHSKETRQDKTRQGKKKETSWKRDELHRSLFIAFPLPYAVLSADSILLLLLWLLLLLLLLNCLAPYSQACLASAFWFFSSQHSPPLFLSHTPKRTQTHPFKSLSSCALR